MNKVVLGLVFTLVLAITASARSEFISKISVSAYNVCSPVQIVGVYGQVRRASDGAGLPGASITLTNQSGDVCATGLSSSFGYYTTSPLVFTTGHIMTVTKKGYQTQVFFLPMVDNTEQNVDMVADE